MCVSFLPKQNEIFHVFARYSGSSIYLSCLAAETRSTTGYNEHDGRIFFFYFFIFPSE